MSKAAPNVVTAESQHRRFDLEQVRDKAQEETRQLLDRGRGLGRDLRQAGRQVWLAGLGTVAAVDEGGRSVFSNLVRAGERLEARTRDSVERPLEQAGERLRSFGKDLESQVEDRVSATVKRFVVPSRREVEELIARVETLTEKVERLSV